jgi:hypothetical protein
MKEERDVGSGARNALGVIGQVRLMGGVQSGGDGPGAIEGGQRRQ